MRSGENSVKATETFEHYEKGRRKLRLSRHRTVSCFVAETHNKTKSRED
jgi:hypothetical protein